MTGNFKSSGWARRASIRETKREDSKIYLDSSRIPLATPLTKLSDGCNHSPSC